MLQHWSIDLFDQKLSLFVNGNHYFLFFITISFVLLCLCFFFSLFWLFSPPIGPLFAYKFCIDVNANTHMSLFECYRFVYTNSRLSCYTYSIWSPAFRYIHWKTLWSFFPFIVLIFLLLLVLLVPDFNILFNIFRKIFMSLAQKGWRKKFHNLKDLWHFRNYDFKNITFSSEKVLDLCKMWPPPPPFLSNVHVLRPSETEKMVFANVSVCVSVCLSVCRFIVC